MKVKELIKKLEAENPDSKVILQKDAEGNGWSPLEDIWTGWYEADSTWSGDAIDEAGFKEDYEDAGNEADLDKAVILVPVN